MNTHEDDHKQGNTETKTHLMQAMLRFLKSEGYRITEPRKLIIEAVAAQVGWHVHPKSVYSYVHERDESVGLATIYRTLKVLEDMDILNQIYSMGAGFHNEELASHYHLICIKCGRIKDVTDSLTDEIKDQIKIDYDFHMTDIALSVYGVCSDCRKGRK